MFSVSISSQIPNHPFLVKNQHSSLYLKVKGPEAFHGAEVHCHVKNGQPNQIWYFDFENSVIRTKLNNFVLEYSKDMNCLVINPFHKHKYRQKWRYEGGNIVSVLEPAFVLTCLDGSRISLAEYHNHPNQIWIFEDCKNDSLTTQPIHNHDILLRNPHVQLYLDVKGQETIPGTEVVCWSKNGQPNQVWFFVANTSVIRTKLNNFVLEYSQMKDHLVINPYISNNLNQKWKYEGGHIISASHPKLLITQLNGSKVTLAKFNGQPNQVWSFEDCNYSMPKHPLMKYSSDESDSEEEEKEEEMEDDENDSEEEEEEEEEKKEDDSEKLQVLNHDSDKICPLEREYFMIQTAVLNDRVLYVYGHHNSSMLCLFKPHRKINQLWYFDENGFIRSSVNDFVFATKGKDSILTMEPYTEDPRHQWRLDGTKILNGLDECLDIFGGKSKNEAQLCSRKFKDYKSQHWRIKM